jgi:hypothetical protein
MAGSSLEVSNVEASERGIVGQDQDDWHDATYIGKLSLPAPSFRYLGDPSIGAGAAVKREGSRLNRDQNRRGARNFRDNHMS